jgi:hypothetical protein
VFLLKKDVRMLMAETKPIKKPSAIEVEWRRIHRVGEFFKGETYSLLEINE